MTFLHASSLSKEASNQTSEGAIYTLLALLAS